MSIDRAKAFIATRDQHLLELAEDYVELISDLMTSKGEAKVCDIASHLGVSHVTVIRTLDRLKKRGLLQNEGPLALTKEGQKLARMCKERHEFLLTYLTKLGVPLDIAMIDVEGMEHHISQETLTAFQRHLKKDA